MLLIFTCEHCGKRFKVEERMQGRRGRCSHCGQVMKIPRVEATDQPDAATSASEPTGAAGPAPAFRLSPAEPRPLPREAVPPPGSSPPRHDPADPHRAAFDLEPDSPGGHPPHAPDDHVPFELLDDDDDRAAAASVSPAIERGLKEMAEFEKDPRGYKIDGDRSGVFALFGAHDLGPASWLYAKWRAGVNFVLKLFRWVDTWAYLISVPFLMLMIFGIAVQHRQFVHTGAVAVVLANYGRFWADLLAFFVRPYKDGPLHGLLFLFPPYMLYYLVTRWGGMKKIVRRIAMSCIPILVVIVIYGFLPSVNPAASSARGFGAKLQAGKEELDKDIESDLSRLKNKLIGVGTTRAKDATRPSNAPEDAAKAQPEPRADEPPPL